jgi:hypothetical protein
VSSKRNVPTPAENQKVSFGKISTSAQSKLAAMKSMTSDLLLEIGRIEFRKNSIINNLRDIDAEAASILASEAKSLGIPDGQGWKVEPDGSAVPN